jgi:hypothetical protein
MISVKVEVLVSHENFSYIVTGFDVDVVVAAVYSVVVVAAAVLVVC